jgi:hypothetical protein
MLLTANYHQHSLGVVTEQHLAGFQSNEAQRLPSSSHPAGIRSERAVRIILERMKAQAGGQESINPCVSWYGEN